MASINSDASMIEISSGRSTPKRLRNSPAKSIRCRLAIAWIARTWLAVALRPFDRREPLLWLLWSWPLPLAWPSP